MIQAKQYTVRQLLVAAGLVKHISRTTLMRDIGVSQSYLTKLTKDRNFDKLTSALQAMPLDKDMQQTYSLAVLFKMIGKFLYTIGEKESDDTA